MKILVIGLIIILSSLIYNNLIIIKLNKVGITQANIFR